MTKKTKLELTWPGKDDRPKLEPRILIENPDKSSHAAARHGDADIFDNMLIKGDNLLALKALEADYAGKVKCIYIDPPYNTGNAFEHYDDGVENSVWLSLIRDRIELLRGLLSDDGYLAVQIDDNQFARLFIILCEMFGQRNLKVICVKMSEASGLKMGAVRKYGIIPKLKEYIIIAKPSGLRGLRVDRVPKEAWDKEYNILLDGFTRDDKAVLDLIAEAGEVTEDDVQTVDKILERVRLTSVADELRRNGFSGKDRERWLFENAFRIVQCATSSTVKNLADIKRKTNDNTCFAVMNGKRDMLYCVRATYSDEINKPRVQMIFAEDNLMVHPGDLWSDIKTTGLEAEGQVSFKNGKKPELLIRRVLQMGTKYGDIVLDSFGGSGTTAAVAHKMGRRWITVEIGDHAETHIIPRLRRVIEGSDGVGATSLEDWKGGGGFRYFTLAPSLLAQDKYGNWVIADDYNPAMLAEAMCKHMGFTYDPSEKEYWRHGASTETDFIYVTTQSLTHEACAKISQDVGPDRSLLICCKAYSAEAEAFVNLTLVKIPTSILQKCEWGRDDYSLNIANLPEVENDGAPTADALPLFGAEAGDE